MNCLQCTVRHVLSQLFRPEPEPEPEPVKEEPKVELIEEQPVQQAVEDLPVQQQQKEDEGQYTVTMHMWMSVCLVSPSIYRQFVVCGGKPKVGENVDSSRLAIK